jgi:hypothetical protein
VNFAVEALVVAKTHRVPIPVTPAGDAAAAVRQFDAAAMTAGFKLSRGLMDRLAVLDAGAVTGLAARVLDVVRREAGDHVQHSRRWPSWPPGAPADRSPRRFPSGRARPSSTRPGSPPASRCWPTP